MLSIHVCTMYSLTNVHVYCYMIVHVHVCVYINKHTLRLSRRDLGGASGIRGHQDLSTLIAATAVPVWTESDKTMTWLYRQKLQINKGKWKWSLVVLSYLLALCEREDLQRQSKLTVADWRKREDRDWEIQWPTTRYSDDQPLSAFHSDYLCVHVCEREREREERKEGGQREDGERRGWK